jgi:tRNA dimethylallyltransferase
VEVEVRALEKSGGIEALVARLRAASALGTGAVDLKNPRRVARALARCLASGRSVPELAAEFARKGTPFDDLEKRLVRLERRPLDLDDRIRVRTHKMIEQGLVDEVRALAPALHANPAAGTAIGYRETLAWLDAGARAPLSELTESIILHTQQLVKKQRAWFRHQVPPHRVVNLSEDLPPGEAPLFD